MTVTLGQMTQTMRTTLSLVKWYSSDDDDVPLAQHQPQAVHQTRPTTSELSWPTYPSNRPTILPPVSDPWYVWTYRQCCLQAQEITSIGSLKPDRSWDGQNKGSAFHRYWWQFYPSKATKYGEDVSKHWCSIWSSSLLACQEEEMMLLLCMPSKTDTKREKCQVPLCFNERRNCNREYHTNWKTLKSMIVTVCSIPFCRSVNLTFFFMGWYVWSLCF